ncbi:probable gluconokinase [Spea bombifrons]|uniref:probable gluconokinase n=1 Tax=Spea bombifrons TaxID=233779 RepID=UPI0023494B87|nr:probable gluconokinase [Spea bombifrons]
MIVVIMGVSGSGKSEVGSILARKMGWKFYDADDYHPVQNKLKMSQGIPLNDQDRHPWLCKLHEVITREKSFGHHVVLACSALKRAYRTTLTTGKNPLMDENPQEGRHDISSDMLFVHLQGSIDIISDRLQKRKGHFMPLTLLESQFQTLEPPADPEVFITVNVEREISETVREIEKELKSKIN